MRLLAIVATLGVFSAAAGVAGDVYKWTDENGQTHFSNQGRSDPGSAAGSEEPTADGEGWESVLERQKGSADVAAQAETAINSLQLKKIRRTRDRERMVGEIEAVRAQIVSAQSNDQAALPSLRAREATQVAELNRVELDLREMDVQITRLRALKQAGREQTGRNGLAQ